jgi:hypothetical protein
MVVVFLVVVVVIIIIIIIIIVVVVVIIVVVIVVVVVVIVVALCASAASSSFLTTSAVAASSCWKRCERAVPPLPKCPTASRTTTCGTPRRVSTARPAPCAWTVLASCDVCGCARYRYACG